MKNLFKSLAAFQQEVPVLHKATQGYGYSYTELSDIMKAINPLLKKHGLGFYQAVEGLAVKTVIFHSESAESIESLTDIPQNVSLKGMNDFQVLGSAITYIRRYALSAMLGIVTDKDIDASGEQLKKETPKQELPTLVKDSTQYNKILEVHTSGKTVTLAQVKSKYTLTADLIENLNSYGIK